MAIILSTEKYFKKKFTRTSIDMILILFGLF